MPQRSLLAAAVLAAALVPALAAGTLDRAADGPVRVERDVRVMGTRLTVAVEAEDRPRALAASEVVLDEIARWEGLLSTWDAATPLSRLNAAPAAAPQRPPQQLLDVLHRADAWAEATGRAFDPTVGPLVDAWGLRSGGRTPTSDELRRALASVGPGAFDLNGPDGTAVRLAADAWIDAGGFGKGAALEAAAGRLRAAGVTAAVLDLGGQIQVVGAGGSDRPAWPVDVAHPLHRDRPVARLLLADASVATSGTSERGRHLLDPRTGTPAPAWGSVTVVGADAFTADVAATALFVLGPDHGWAWARARPDLAALFLALGDDGVLRARWTPALTRWLDGAPDLPSIPSPAG